MGGLSEVEERGLLRLLAKAEGAADLPAPRRQQVLESVSRVSWWPRLWPAFGLAAAAVVALVVLSPWRNVSEEGERIKGAGDIPAPVWLELGALERSGAVTEHLGRIAPGAKVPARYSLVFQVSTQGPCVFSLVRQGPDGAVEVLLPAGRAEVLAAGVHTLERDGQPLGLPLAGLDGRQVFLALCTLAPVPAGEIPALAKQLLSGHPEQAALVSFDRLEVEVIP
jgi:hypothetical protein